MYNFVLFILVVVVSNEMTDATGCPSGFISHGNSCYLFSHDTTTWAGAYLSCQIMDSSLVEIENTAEHDFLKGVIQGLGGNWLIGATDKQVEGEFLWIDSKVSLAHSFSKWGPTEPTNSNHDESCILLYNPINYDWVDASCEAKVHYICKKSGSSSGQIVG